MARNTTEIPIEQHLVKRVREKGGLAIKLIDMASGGFPDRTCLLPNGKILFVECKAPKGVLSPRQHLYIAKIKKLGFDVTVVYSKEDVDAIFA